MLVMFIVSVICALQLVFNYDDDGLSSYKPSYSLILARFTLGNLVEADRKTYIIQSAADVFSMIVLFGFYFHWRSYSKHYV